MYLPIPVGIMFYTSLESLGSFENLMQAAKNDNISEFKEQFRDPTPFTLISLYFRNSSGIFQEEEFLQNCGGRAYNR